MKTEIDNFEKETVISLLPDVTYSQVPFWFGATIKPLKMDILMPKHERKMQPTILWICGGAYQQVDRHVWIPELVWYAKHGFTVASVEYRTSMEASWPAQIIDVKAAVRYLKAHAQMYCVDPNKIAVMGESAGGHLANMVGVTGKVKEFEQGEYPEQDSSVRAVVDFYGLSEISDNIANADGINHGNPEELLMGCSYTQDPKLYASASAFTYIDATCPPFLILHGDKDPLVSIEQSEKLYDALKHAGITVEMDVYKGVGHGADEFYQESTKQRIKAFLDKVL